MPKGYQVFDINRLTAGIVAYDKTLRDGAVEALRETVKEGEQDVRNTIYASVTMTGERRQATTGGHPGRVETGEMVGNVDSEVDSYGDDLYVGRFGWTKDFEDYYGLQEEGTQHIEGMDALGSAFIRAEDRLMDRLSAVVRKRS